MNISIVNELIYIQFQIFISGRTCASLSELGNEPAVVKELFIMPFIVGNKAERHFLSRCAGMGSSSHEALLVFLLSGQPHPQSTIPAR